MSGKVINVATGTRISLNDLFNTLKSITGATRRAGVRARPAPATCATRSPTSRAPATSSATRPLVGLEEGLRETVAWYVSTQQPA